jgi:hypothetical protein
MPLVFDRTRGHTLVFTLVYAVTVKVLERRLTFTQVVSISGS